MMNQDHRASATNSRLNHAALPLLLAATLVGAGCSTSQAGDATAAAGSAKAAVVFSRVGTGYIRARNPDGPFKLETYQLKNGGSFGGARSDETMDKLDFQDLSPSIGRALAVQNYVAAANASEAQLLILVYCGITVVPADAAPEDRDPAALPNWPSSYGGIDPAYSEAVFRYRPMKTIDARNAEILGFTDALVRTSPNSLGRDALMAELEQDRYYVVFLAFDSSASGDAAKRPLLWQVRVSIPAAQNSIENAFPEMVRIASQYLGRNSRGLVNRRLDGGEASVGDPKANNPQPIR
jgi:hypothetical protein